MMLQAALALAQRGLAVFPCQVRDKRPATGRGCLEATTDADTIREWWGLIPNANVAVATGAVSGVFVVDVDSSEAETELRKLEAELGPLPSTVEVITRKGRHIYFKYPDGCCIRNSASKLAPGIDVRGDGGYVLSPPSIHPSGRRYCWSVDSGNTFAVASQWLIERLSSKGNGRAATPSEVWLQIATEGVSEGERNATLTRLAGILFRRCINIDPMVLLELLQGWNAGRCNPPLPPDDVCRIVNSIAGRELKRRNGNG